MRSQTLKEARLSFCPKAEKWSRKYKTLNQAWAACNNGCWMAWWLYHYKEGNYSLFFDLSMFASSVGLYAVFTGYDATSAQKKAFADLLRKNFYSSGRWRNA